MLVEAAQQVTLATFTVLSFKFMENLYTSGYCLSNFSAEKSGTSDRILGQKRDIVA